MKKFTAALLTFMVVSIGHANNPFTKGFINGDIKVQSINRISFGPGGILFMGDPMNARLIALETGDITSAEVKDPLNITDIDRKIAAFLGTEVDQIAILDMAVNPISKKVYLSVARNNQPVLLRVKEDSFEEVMLNNVNYGSIELANPVSNEAERRGRKLRPLAITDIEYFEGNVYVTGLSNEEFASTFRIIPFPLQEKQQYNTLEIYHVSHGRYETYAPVRTFLPYKFSGTPHLVAGYTCTPLVTVPINNIENKGHVKGKTVAELGNRNTPTDIITIKQNEKEYLLVANSIRTLMKIDPEDIEKQQSLIEPLKERSGTAGVKFLAVAEVYVEQMDNYGDDYVLTIRRMPDGTLMMRSLQVSRI